MPQLNLRCKLPLTADSASAALQELDLRSPGCLDRSRESFVTASAAYLVPVESLLSLLALAMDAVTVKLNCCQLTQSQNGACGVQIGDMRGLQGLLMIIVMYLFPFNLPGRKYKAKEQAAMGNTALACHRGRLLALNEAGYPIEVKLNREGSMSTGEVVRYEGRLDHPFTAHPKIDPATNEMCFFGYECAFHQPWACMKHEACCTSQIKHSLQMCGRQ